MSSDAPNLSAWRLAFCSNKSFGFRPGNLDYFNEYFVGKPLPEEWQPPPLEVKGKNYKPKDIVPWMLSAPVVSGRARDALVSVVGDFAEFRFMGDFKRVRFYCMNVFFAVDCLGFECSDILWSPSDPERILNVHSYCFRPEAIPNAPIFKESNHPGNIFVRQPFVECLRAHKLRGAALLDLAVSPFYFILHGGYVDAIEGYNFKAT